MNHISCEKTANMLIDYADGQLSPDQTSQVTGHLASCDNCRKLLQALQKSLKLTQGIWEDNLSDIATVPMPPTKKLVKPHRLKYAAIAASILFLLSVSAVWQIMEISAKSYCKVSIAEIELSIAQAASAARLLAATDYLAKQPGYEDVVKEQYTYITQIYPNTSGAEDARQRLNNYPERSLKP